MLSGQTSYKLEGSEGVIPMLVFPVWWDDYIILPEDDAGESKHVAVLTVYKILLIYTCCAFVGLYNKFSSNVAFSNFTYRTVHGILLKCSVKRVWVWWDM